MRLLVVAACALALAACSAAPDASVTPQAQNPAALTAAQAVTPDVACPVSGREYSSGNASIRMSDRRVFTGMDFPMYAVLVFKNVSDSFHPPAFEPVLTTCGPRSNPKPAASIKSFTIRSKRTSCTNGVCRIELEYVVGYNAPKTIARRPWKFDLLSLKPQVPQKPYGRIPAVRVQIDQF